MSQGGGVSRIGKLADHFLIGEYLAGVGTTELKQAAQ
jgi:hypothetical protein